MKARDPFFQAARKMKAGPMKNKKLKRKQNKERKLLQEQQEQQ